MSETTYGISVLATDTTNPMDYEARTVWDDGELVQYTLEEAIAFCREERITVHLLDASGERCGRVGADGEWRLGR